MKNTKINTETTTENKYPLNTSPVPTEDTFHLLPKGYYSFKVWDYDEGEVRDCPCMIVKLYINNKYGKVIINHYIFLSEGSEHKVNEFFASIGMKNWDWDQIVGKEGVCRLVKKKLKYKTINSVEHFTEKE